VPILVDCRQADFNIDVADATAKIETALAKGAQVKAIIPMHYGGQMADAAGVAKLAARFGLKVIEDAAHCCPAFYRDDASAPWRSVGSSADISCFSFYANKTITTGEGGMACTENDAYAERMRIMSLHGISKDAWKRFTADGSWYYEIVAPGFKYNLTDIAAAIGLHQIRKANRLHQQRTERARLYTSGLKDVDELILPQTQPNRIHSWHLYVIRLKLDRLKIDRAQFISELKQRGIGTSVHWMPLHMHPYYRETYGYQPGDLPIAAALYPEIISLPIYPDIAEETVAYVCQSIVEVITRHRK
jgi:perosamine synthetase